MLAVAARSSADERALMADAPGVATHELRVGDAVVGRLRLRGRSGEPSPALLRLVTTLIASEVERVRAPERASEAAQEAFLRAVLHRQVTDRGDIVARAAELGVDARRRRGGDRRARAPLRAGRGRLARARARRRRARRARRRAGLDRGDRRACRPTPPARSSCSRRPTERRRSRRTAEAVAARAAAPRCTASRSRSATRASRTTRSTSTAPATRRCWPRTSPRRSRRRGRDGDAAAVLAFEATGAYRLLLPAMSEDPGELQRFYAETVEPLVAYDEQYETDLVQTLETFLECDGNVANTASRLFTHRHTIRYRLERVRDLSGLDVSSTDGREKLGLGLKAMRVLGIAAPRGPATERGARGGRVPRGGKDADGDPD